jgi:sugar phosphate isomerase/epimerase
MYIGCTSFSFDKDIIAGKRNLKNFLDICKDLQIKGVEFWDEHIEKLGKDNVSLKELKQEVVNRGLEFITIAVNNHDFTSLDPEIRKNDIKKVISGINIMDDLNCKILRVLPGDLIALNREEEKLFPLTVLCFEECLKLAEDKKIVLAIENCPKNTDPTVVKRIIEEFSSPFLKACPDIGNIRKDIRYKAFEPLLPFAVHIHAKTYHFEDDGRETFIDYERVMKMIYNQNYEGCISIEYEGDGDEFEGVTNSVRLIKRYLRIQ